MEKQAKVRNIRNEYKHSFIWNLIAIFVIMAVFELLFPKTGGIGLRTMAALYIVDGGLTLMFMYLMEKYGVAVSGLYEKCVVTVLSVIYTFVVMCFVNVIFFNSKEKFCADIAISLCKVIGIFGVDIILKCIRCNEKKYKKPKLLIIDSTAENFYRMKRIKYGVINNYDSWYESVEGFTAEKLSEFADEKFGEYDAVCVLDGLTDEEYHIAVSKATEYNLDIFIVPKIIDVGKTNAKLVRFDDVLTLYMPKRSLTYVEVIIKRFLDIVISLVGMIFAAIPMVFIAFAIKLTSPGPVFYKQTRLTKDKKEFDIYKFRTMIPDAEKLSGPKFAEKDDPRITPVGKFLRACRLDELPQILNILKGDMSVVGPRPERPVFVEQFEKEIVNYDYRFGVKAGLTSLSHVYGRYSTYIHDRTYYDLFYISHYSLFLDIKIMLLTSKTLFLKSAAEGEDDFKAKTVADANTEVTTN